MYNPLESRPEAGLGQASFAHGTNDVEERAADALLERFLDALCAPLFSDASGEEMRELRLEIRGHILALSSAYCDLGSRPVEAMRAALAQFGAPAQIGQQLGRERRKPGQRARHAMWTALCGLAAGWLGANFMLFMNLVSTGNAVADADSRVIGSVVGCAVGLIAWRTQARPITVAKWTGSGMLSISLALLAFMLWQAPLHIRTLLAHWREIVWGLTLLTGSAAAFGFIAGSLSSLIRRLERSTRAHPVR